MRLFFLLFSLFFGCHPISAQSLEALYATYYKISGTDTASIRKKTNLLAQLIEKETHQTPTKALKLIDTLAELHLKTNNIQGYNRVKFYSTGFVYATIENLPEALKYYQAYAKVFPKKGIDDGYFLIDVGNLYYDLKLFQMANRYYKDAEIIFKNENFYRGLTTVYGNYALVAKNTNQIDTAFHYIFKTLEIQKEFSRDTFQIAHTYQVLGRLYLENKKDYKAAIPYFQQSIAFLSDEKLKTYYRYQQFIHLLPIDYMFLGQCLYGIGQSDTAFTTLNKAITIAKEIEQHYVLTLVLIGAAEALLEQKLYNQAERYFLEAEALCVQHETHTMLVRCYNGLKNLYTATKAPEKALLYWDKYNAERDTLQNQEDKFLVMNDQVLQQERINTIQEQEDRLAVEAQLRSRLFIILGLIVLGLILVLFFWWNLRQKNKIIALYTNQLESNNAVKEMMLSVIGHDLRSLFNVLMGNSGNLLKIIQQKRLTALEKDSTQLNTASKKAYMMMDGLMQWVTLQKEKTAPDLKKIRLIDVINTTVEPLQPILWTSTVELSIKVDDVFVRADFNLLQVVLRNLLTNAIRYSPVNDTILIQSKIQDNQNITLIISDNGSGIEEDLLNKLFVQQKNLNVAIQGSGLGLKIVKELCDILKIQIKAYNKDSGGAVFELILPIEGHVLANPDTMQALEDQIIEADVLSHHDLDFLIPFAEELKKLEIFEGTEIQLILDKMNQDAPTPTVKKWIYDFTNTVYHSDSELYNKMLEKVLK